MLLENIKIFWGYPTFSGLMVGQLCLGESITDLLGILCLFRAYGRPTLLGEILADSCPTLRGVEVSWVHSSAELTLVPRRTERLDRLDNSLLPQLLREKVPVEVLITAGRQTFFW